MVKILTLLLVIMLGQAAHAQTPFYQGKTITIVVGTKAGDAYDLYPRMLAEFMPNYIPGNPNIIIQNVPGAASMIAANQVYNVSKPDGLTIGAIYPALYFEQLTKKPEAKFDWTKFGWVGNPVTSNHLLYMRSDAPFKSMDDIKNAKEAPKCGSNGITSTGYYLPKLMEETLGTKFDIVLGYQSGQDVDLAVERGEVVCRAFTITGIEMADTLQSVRDLSQLLHPSVLDDFGLPETLTAYLRSFSKRTGIQTDFVQHGMTARLAPDTEVCVYRIVQEALTNVARHSGARRVRVTLERTDDALTLLVEDDGRGIESSGGGETTSGGLGLVGMRERAQAVGGSFAIRSQPGQGTKIQVLIPIRPAGSSFDLQPDKVAS